ncbi:hypothetical protein HDV05_005210 [Chytridiales sp. JEL 0842]|nr:hypothetical protein HDV05_005210 [Chytridiales sp. JEL 0842]
MSTAPSIGIPTIFIPDLLHPVFTHLANASPKDVFEASLVCKNWFSVGSRFLWRELKLNTDSWSGIWGARRISLTDAQLDETFNNPPLPPSQDLSSSSIHYRNYLTKIHTTLRRNLRRSTPGRSNPVVTYAPLIKIMDVTLSQSFHTHFDPLDDLSNGMDEFLRGDASRDSGGETAKREAEERERVRGFLGRLDRVVEILEMAGRVERVILRFSIHPQSLHPALWNSISDSLLRLIQVLHTKHQSSDASLKSVKMVLETFSFFDFVLLEKMGKGLKGVLDGVRVDEGWLPDPGDVVRLLTCGCAGLRDLELSKVQLHSSITDAIHTHSKTLQKLHLTSITSSSSHIDPTSLTAVLSHCLSLKTLILKIECRGYHHHHHQTSNTNSWGDPPIEFTDSDPNSYLTNLSRHLTHVDVTGCLFLNDTLPLMLSTHCRKLEVAVFRQTSVSDVGVRAILRSCPRIRKLDVGRCRNVSVNTLWTLSELGHQKGGLKSLKEVGIAYASEIWKSPDVLKAVLKVLEVLQGLRKVEVAPAAFPSSWQVSEEARLLMDVNLCFNVVEGPEGCIRLEKTEMGKLPRGDLTRMARVRFEGRLEVDLNLKVFRELVRVCKDGGEETEGFNGMYEFEAFKAVVATLKQAYRSSAPAVLNV